MPRHPKALFTSMPNVSAKLPLFAKVLDDQNPQHISAIWKNYFLALEQQTNSGFVQSVNGTTYRITVTGDPLNPIVDISADYDAMIAAEIAAALAYLDAVHAPVVATEDIAAFVVVTSQGKNANSGTLSGIDRIIGISDAAIATGFSGTVTMIGVIENPIWSWSTGDPIFLNGSSLSTIAPSTGFTQRIGTAKNSTTVYVDLGEPVML